MKLSKKLIALTLALFQVVLSFSFINCSAISPSIDENVNTYLVNAIDYLKSKQSPEGAWICNNLDYTPEINNTLEYIYNSNTLIDLFEVEEEILNISFISEEFMRLYNINNTDVISHYLLTDNFQSKDDVNLLLLSQNPDGGFGLAENYTGEIIGTKLDLRALADLDKTEAMTKAAIYIASRQNADGGVFDDPMATGCFFSTGVQNLT